MFVARLQLFIKDRAEAISSYGGNPANLGTGNPQSAENGLSRLKNRVIQRFMYTEHNPSHISKCLLLSEHYTAELTETVRAESWDEGAVGSSQHAKLLEQRRKISCLLLNFEGS